MSRQRKVFRAKRKWREDSSPARYYSSKPQLVDFIIVQEDQNWKNKGFLQQKYVSEGLSLRQIAAEVSSSKQTVCKNLKLFGIPLRNKSHHHGNPSQERFGQRIVKNSLIDHQHEQRVIESVRRMKDEGLGLRAIARCLDELKIPTKNRGKKWHPEMVKRVLSRL